MFCNTINLKLNYDRNNICDHTKRFIKIYQKLYNLQYFIKVTTHFLYSCIIKVEHFQVLQKYEGYEPQAYIFKKQNNITLLILFEVQKSYDCFKYFVKIFSNSAEAGPLKPWLSSGCLKLTLEWFPFVKL